MKIKYIDLSLQTKKIEPKLLAIFKKVISSGQFVGGSYISVFEKEMSKYLGVKHCVALNSGTDALTFAMHSLGIKRGDEVITPQFIYCIYSSNYSSRCKPVFVDVLPDQNIDFSKIENVLTKKLKQLCRFI